MRFFVLSVLFVALLGFCLISTSEATSSVNANVTTLSLAAVTADADTDSSTDEENAEACGRGCRVKACVAACGAKIRRVVNACRGWRPFRGRCSSCG